MGGAVAKGQNNDELIDNLVEASYIEDKEIEKAFRGVDRGEFFPGVYIEDAYKDIAMKCDDIHISAPCIYCVVLENFELLPGLSFLNIGSGTGYLSTLVGLLLGPYGTNHGIDVSQGAIEYSKKKVEEFILYSDGFDPIKFCHPKFVCCNVESFDMMHRKYNRVYCGARVFNKGMLHCLKNLLAEDGVLIYPHGEFLVKCHRVGEEAWEDTNLLHVQFADLVPQEEADKVGSKVHIDVQPPQLQELCRYKVLKSFGKEKQAIESLPISKTLIRYLKYYRDPARPKPPNNKRTRTSSEGAINFDVL